MAAATAAPADCVLPDGGSMGRLDWDTFRRPIGTVRAVMLFVDFPDVPATRAVDGIVEDLSLANASGWLARSSNGKVSLEIEPLRQWLRMPEPLSAYKRVNGALIDDVARRYTAQAVALADPAVDFSQVDIVYIVPNPEATAYARSSSTTTSPEEGPIADGRVLRASVTFGTAVYERGYRTLVHETSHTFGLYDYYNAFGRPTDKYAGAWSLMADSIRGADHFAWDKWRMGWLADAQVRCITGPTRAEYVLSPLETSGRGQGGDPADRAALGGRRRVPHPAGSGRGHLLDRRPDLQGEQRPRGRRRPDPRLGCATAVRLEQTDLWRRTGRCRVRAGRSLDRLHLGPHDRRLVRGPRRADPASPGRRRTRRP